MNNIINEALESHVQKVVVVLGAFAEEISSTLQTKSEAMEVVRNNNWQSGMGASIKTGVKYAISCNQNADKIILITCDQPFVSSNLLDLFIKQADFQSDKTIVSSRYSSDNYGVPVLFKKPLFEELMTINDKRGAKSVVETSLAFTTFIDFPKGAIDIDTKDDLQYLEPDM